MRVAFTLFGDDSWTGGLNYLRNLLSALHEVPGRPIEAVLFMAPQASVNSVAELTSYLNEPPIIVQSWDRTWKNHARNILRGVLLQCDYGSLAAFRAARIDVVFQNDAWYGARFPIPMLFWIPDFQHKHLKEMFSPLRRFKRDFGHAIMCRLAARVMVSSEDARIDCESYLPNYKGKIAVVPFAVQVIEDTNAQGKSDVLLKYALPKKYFFFPGQLWRHKNHLALLAALGVLRDCGSEVVVVATGSPNDRRNPDHPKQVLDTVEKLGLQQYFRFLGMIPYADVAQLMRTAAALVNPSLFEGWSTTVEEAKAQGVPMLLSDLQVHREQATRNVNFFNPRDPHSIADVMKVAWNELEEGPREAGERSAIASYGANRMEFGDRFVRLVSQIAMSSPR